MSDSIDRTLAIATLVVAKETGSLMCKELKGVIEVLNRMPPAQQWIPCSERLPEKPNVYTVTDSNGRVVRFVFTGTDSSREYWKRCAKAWMPLPEPYREE